MAQTIQVTIVDGEVTISTRGFKGKACTAATADLEKALGRTTKSMPTAEMNAPVTSTVKAGS